MLKLNESQFILNVFEMFNRRITNLQRSTYLAVIYVN